MDEGNWNNYTGNILTPLYKSPKYSALIDTGISAAFNGLKKINDVKNAIVIFFIFCIDAPFLVYKLFTLSTLS